MFGQLLTTKSAWNTLGHAMRHATALGLHLKVTDKNVSDIERVRRARTWYSLYSLEMLIAEITGRPKSISLIDVTIPVELLLSVPEEIAKSFVNTDSHLSFRDSRNIWLQHLHHGRHISQMTGGMVPWKSFAEIGFDAPTSYLPNRVLLCRISDRIANGVYTGTSDIPWSEIQARIGDLQKELEHWARDTPDELTIQGHELDQTDPRARIELKMYFHSVEMILHRPCLCVVEIEDESARSKEFNESSGKACVQAAMSMLEVLPNFPTAHEAYQLLPFWSLLHFIAQATAVLMLEMALDAHHLGGDMKQLAIYVRKSMEYLWCVADGSLSAYRAWRLFRQLLSEVMQRHGDLDLGDIPTEATPPLNWNDDHEAMTVKAFADVQQTLFPFPSQA
jgi:hypothetical protein